uniref:EPIDERMAL PATTERNING FACTOR-like protein 8 n=1 Tax=Erigeron canadensis TaxID=72917 RepID=UPI001CB8A7C7|nr:EPIDERMAL PATTERNING FACTOR-like protein 8 [Erigeron canadensis]
MAPARTYLLLSFRVVVTAALILIFSTVVSHSIPGYDGDQGVRQNKRVIGSRPPGCVNKCVNCRPCQATLVIPPHPKMINYRAQSHWEDNYYLLSWKCKCGDKLFQP